MAKKTATKEITRVGGAGMLAVPEYLADYAGEGLDAL